MAAGNEESYDFDISSKQCSETEMQEYLNSRKPTKQVLHFSDGDLEYPMENDIVSAQYIKAVNEINPNTLTWLPWAWYQTSWMGSKLLNGCDYVGECLASFFGITSPKYQFEINEFYRRQALESEIMQKQDMEMGGWNSHSKNNLNHNAILSDG